MHFVVKLIHDTEKQIVMNTTMMTKYGNGNYILVQN